MAHLSLRSRFMGEVMYFSAHFKVCLSLTVRFPLQSILCLKKKIQINEFASLQDFNLQNLNVSVTFVKYMPVKKESLSVLERYLISCNIMQVGMLS